MAAGKHERFFLVKGTEKTKLFITENQDVVAQEPAGQLPSEIQQKINRIDADLEQLQLDLCRLYVQQSALESQRKALLSPKDDELRTLIQSKLKGTAELHAVGCALELKSQTITIVITHAKDDARIKRYFSQFLKDQPEVKVCSKNGYLTQDSNLVITIPMAERDSFIEKLKLDNEVLDLPSAFCQLKG